MSHSTNGSDDEMLSSDRTDSPSIDEGSSRRGLKRGAGLKKGPWTSAEDAMLRDYVSQHGEGNWNAVQKQSGLSRCGKSCRLRWANHLRPNLKKGAFTADEERVIVELHSKLGNKWARMATKLPGRTDNEIKNYWNTRIKRRQRAGLPLYPADIQAPGENYRTNDSGEFGSGVIQHPDLQTNNLEIPDIVFEHLKGNQGVFTCAPVLPDISFSSMLTRGLGSSQGYNFMPTTMPCPKRLRGTETLFPGFGGSVSNGETPFDQFHGVSYEMLSHPSGLSLPYDPHHNRRIPPQFGAMPGSHALLNGNFSASKPIQGAVKLELPSLQYPEPDLGFWDTSPPQPPSLESVDTFIRSPSPTRLYLSDCPSPRNSGLLDALLHEAQTLSSTKNLPSEKSPNSFVATPGDVIDDSNLNLCDMALKEHGDPISPLSHSAESVFSECIPFSEHESVNSLPVTNTKPVPVVPKKAKENPNKLDLSRPDALLDAGWFERSDECRNGQSIVNDTIASVFGDDLCSNYKQVAGGNSALSQGWMVGPYNSWNNMPSVCQMFEQP